MALFYQCRSCGEIRPLPELAFYEITSDGIWIKCTCNGKYELHRLISEPGPRTKRNEASPSQSWLKLKERARQMKLNRVGQRIKGLLGIGASH
jgi:hypothetical protein